MATDDNILKLIVELTRLTARKEITWAINDKVSKYYKERGKHELLSVCYVAKCKDKQFAIFEARALVEEDDDETFYEKELRQIREASGLFAKKKKLINSRSIIIFAIVDDLGRILWEAPLQYSALDNLYEAVTEQASGLNDFIKDLFSDVGNTQPDSKSISSIL